MLKSLYPDIDWERIRAVGFDLDGTLYDEAEFISQVYRSIADYLSVVCDTSSDEIHRVMFRRWLEKGSSYNRIFGEILEQYNVKTTAHSGVISNCLTIFRGFEPCLALPARVEALLNYMHERYTLFMISDGSATLQNAKFRALGLESWFSPEKVGISGCYGQGFSKPSTEMLAKLEYLHCFKPYEVVFFGDRAVDEQFAVAAGFQYVACTCLIPTKR